MRRSYFLIGILIITSLACGLVSTATQSPASTNTPAQPSSTPEPSETPTQVPAGTQTSVAEGTVEPTKEEPTKTPYPTSVLDSQMSSEINLIQTQVIQERQLQPRHPVPVVLLTADELKTNVINDFLADYTDEKSSDDVLELSTVGLLEPGFDLKQLYIELYSEEIAGYYDNETAEMFVVKGEGFQGPEHLTYSHEYTHVLQDQNYDINHGLNYNDDACEKDSERCAGIQALLEGDATLSEYLWETYFASSTDKQQIDAYRNSLKTPIYDSAPAFLKDDFIFPYNQGATFVVDKFNQGGWSAVDAIYRDPPVSTEQILHPNLYPSDKPIPVDLPDLTSALGSGWRQLESNQMGEWYTYLILADAADTNARIDQATAQAAAAGWGGDEYVLLHNDAMNTTVFAMKTVWDTTNDATEFSNTFEKYANARFGVTAEQQGNTLTWSYAGGFSSLLLSGDTTLWIMAPNAAVAQTVSGIVHP